MKKVIALILALAMVFALAACGGSTSAAPAAEAKTDGAAAPAAEPVGLTFAAHFSNTIKLGETISKAKEILEEKSGGTMTLDMYFNEALMKQSAPSSASAKALQISPISPRRTSAMLTWLAFSRSSTLPARWIPLP